MEDVMFKMPELPSGYAYTGVYRCPKEGEYYHSSLIDPVVKAPRDAFVDAYPILKKVPWGPKVGEWYFSVDGCGIITHSVAHQGDVGSLTAKGFPNQFKTKEEAEVALLKIGELLRLLKEEELS